MKKKSVESHSRDSESSSLLNVKYKKEFHDVKYKKEYHDIKSIGNQQQSQCGTLCQSNKHVRP